MLTSAVLTLQLDFFQKSAQGPFSEVFVIPVCQASLVQAGWGEAVMWIRGHKAMTSGSHFLAELSEPCFVDNDFLTGHCQN